MTKYIISEKGEEIISLNQKDNKSEAKQSSEKENSSSQKFTEVNFEDLGNDED